MCSTHIMSIHTNKHPAKFHSSNCKQRQSQSKSKIQIHRFLLLLLFSIIVLCCAFVLQHDWGGRHPLIPRQQLHGNHILVHCSVEVLKTLDENLGASRRHSAELLTYAGTSLFLTVNYLAVVPLTGNLHLNTTWQILTQTQMRSGRSLHTSRFWIIVQTLQRCTFTHLCVVLPLSLDKDCGLQIVVPAGPEGALEEGATLNSCLDLGQREVLWE